MKFTDYPKDLQRIVELTPEGWEADERSSMCTMIGGTPVFTGDGHNPYFIGKTVFSKGHYNQCRAQWLAEKAEVDWRGLCEELTQWLNRANRIGIEEWNRDAIDRVIDKARKALEQTK